MARRRKKNIRSEIERAANRKNLRSHIRALGLQSEDEYRAWCRKRGLGDGLHKSNRQIQKERQLALRQQGEAALARTRPAHAQPGQHHPPALRPHAPQGAARCGLPLQNSRPLQRLSLWPDATRFARHSAPSRASRRPLAPRPPSSPRSVPIRRITSSTAWLPWPVIQKTGCAPWPSGHRRVTTHASSSTTSPATCWPATMCPFLWTRHFSLRRCQRRACIRRGSKHIGAGQNIRTADLPVALSKKSAHCFLAAPCRPLHRPCPALGSSLGPRRQSDAGAGGDWHPAGPVV